MRGWNPCGLFRRSSRIACVAKAEGAEKERIINYMRSISPEAVIDDEGYITKQNAQ